MPTVTIGEQTGADFSGGIDTGINMAAPTANKGGDATFESSVYLTASSFVEHGLIAFPGLSNISGPVTVSAASLFLYIDSMEGNGADQTHEMYRLLRNWVEAEATWNVYSTGNNWGTAGGTNATDRSASASSSLVIPDSGSGYQEFTGAGMIALVEGWINGTFPNYGVHLQHTNVIDATNFCVWRSSENATATTRPYLSVTYEASGGGGSSLLSKMRRYL